MPLLTAVDASARLSAACQWLSSYPPDSEILLIAPSREAGDEIARRLTLSSGARFGLARFTLNQLATVLAAPALAESELAPATRLALTAIAARAVHSLHVDGSLSYFEPVATKPGFPAAIAETLAELRLNNCDARALASLGRAGGDLAVLAEKVEAELADARIADLSIVLAAATNAINEPNPPHWVGLPLLLLDVPVASAMESRLVSSLAQRASAVFATAAKGDDRTIGYLERALNCQAVEQADSSPCGSLSKLKHHLFEVTPPDASALDDSVQLASWPGESRECAEIARQIQAEAAAGVPFDCMAIFLRSAGEYSSHLEEAFRRAAIPAYFARGSTRPDSAGRALLALLACKAEGLSVRRFAEYVSLAQVPQPTADASGGKWVPPRHDLIPTTIEIEGDLEPDSESDRAAESGDGAVVDGTLRAPWRWERLLVESAVIGSEERWERRITGLERELRLRREEVLDDDDENRAVVLDRDIQDLIHLREFAVPLIRKLASLPARAIWGDWLGRLSDLATAALREPDGVLETLAELAPMSPVGPVELFEVQKVLTPRLQDLAVVSGRRRYGAVFVGPAEAARGLTFDVVFVPGLAEKLFPRKVIEDPILLDSERRQLAGTDLETQRDRVRGEQLALRLAIGAAQRRAYLSYPRIDVQQARPRVPSFYGLEALRAAEGLLPGFDELSERAGSRTNARLGWPAPERAEDAIDEAEYDLALLGHIVDADPETVSGTAHYLLDSNPYLARALRSRSRKWLRRWTAYDGMVEPDVTELQALAPHQLSARSFSPTGLQNYAACPYRFFLQAILRLQPRAEPVALEAIDPLTRGSLFHKVQYQLLTQLRKAGMLPVTPRNIERAIEEADGVLDRVAARYADELWPAIPRVWEDGVNLIRADLREWLRLQSQAQDDWVPSKFELSFGLADRGREDEDPSSVPDAVQIAGELRLRGSIDLVERHSAGKLRATDHKTGKARAKDGVVIGGGHHLQPVLYALACEKLLGEPVESGRLYYCTADGGYEDRVVALDDYARGYAEIMVTTIGRALEAGFLPAAPDKDACVWCDYLAVCGPNEERRVREKPQNRLVALKGLRELP